jgi:NAD(P)-dependent dehydrogenase (short-subunit alcohol dehydrogenase family)
MRPVRVVVTGSSREIGRAIARRFAQGGARVSILAGSLKELEATRAELLELTQEVRATALDLFIPGSAPANRWRGVGCPGFVNTENTIQT